MIMTAFTGLAFTSFTNQHEQGPSKAFQPSWWFWLTMTGLGLGATVSVKWVGLFTIAWVGSLTLVQLWILLGDTRTVTPVSPMLSFFEYFADGLAAFVCQTRTCESVLFDHNSSDILHGTVRYSFCLPCKSGRW